jgi:hypothetical protein
MRMVENLKAGRKISMDEILSDPVCLKKKIEELTESGHKIKKPLLKLKNRLCKINGAASGAKLIREFIKKQL